MKSTGGHLGLLLIRLWVGGLMAVAHGLPKLTAFSERMHSFPDPLGVGSPVSLGLTVFAEFFCALGVAFGFFTRLATIPLIITMGVAAFVIHAADPWPRKEFPLLYAGVFLGLFFTGPGRYSLTSLLWRGALR